jgi:hypothetical protein
MAPTKFKPKGKWKQFQAAIDPKKFAASARRHLKTAMTQTAQYIRGEIRRGIRSGGYAPNAELTKLLKGSTKPLVGSTAELWKGVTYQVPSYRMAFVGVLRQSGAYNVALTVHDGKNIRVSPKMRGMFWLLWKTSIGQFDPGKLRGRTRELWDQLKRRGIIKPLDPGTTVIRIPPRPFIRAVFDSKKVQATVKANFAQAISEALKGK